MPPAQYQAWQVLLRLEELDLPWVLIGGQMMALLAAEHGVPLPRLTLDADVLVDVRANRLGLETLSRWLVQEGFRSDVSAEGIGHRFSRAARRRSRTGLGRV